jgi:hypothetical protein
MKENASAHESKTKNIDGLRKICVAEVRPNPYVCRYLPSTYKFSEEEPCYFTGDTINDIDFISQSPVQ